MSELSEILETVYQRSTDIYKKGGTKSAFAGLNKTLGDISRQIREKDINVSLYRQRKAKLADAKVIEEKFRTERRKKLEEKTNTNLYVENVST